MSQITTNLKQIEDLDVNQLADALELNGYASCVGVIRTKHIDGQAFLKLTEYQLSLWRLPHIEARRLRSFVQQIKNDPEQFLINSSIKQTTTVNMLNKSPVAERTKSSKPNFSNNKPNICAKPYRSQKPAETLKENFLMLNKQESKLTDKEEKFEKITKEVNPRTLTTQESTKSLKDEIENTRNGEMPEAKSSTLTKQESKMFKNKLESFLRNEAPTSSFIYKQKQPSLPPKPDHLKVTANSEPEESPVDYNDGYLAPITRVKEPQTPVSARITSTISRNDSNRNSFLHRSRKNYDHLEIRPEVIPNDYEEQSAKQKVIVQNRPLPPVPMEIRKLPIPVTTLDTDDEELAEYAAVPDQEEPMKKEKNHRPLPPVPLQEASKIMETRKLPIPVGILDTNDEELAEYAAVPDQEEPIKKEKNHRPLPPVPLEEVSQINQLSEVQQNRYQLDNGEDDEELADYTPVIEEEKTESKGVVSHRIIKITRSPLPPLHMPMSTSKSKLKERAKFPTPESDKEELSPKLQQMSLQSSRPNLNTSADFSSATLPTHLNRVLKPSAATLPKPPTNLPKPPIRLIPSLDNSHEQINFNFPTSQPVPEDKPVSALRVAKIESVDHNPDEIDEEEFYTDIDLAREPCYRETDRKGARRLLTGLDNGAFIIRPSRQPQFICTISIMHSKRMFNLGLEKNSKGALAFGSVVPDFDQPQFYSIAEVIAYYSLHPLYLSGESILLKDILPRNKY